MFKGSHEARAALNAALRAGRIELPGPSVSIFRLLLDHAWYTERSYGFVNQVDPDSDYSIRGFDDIATLTGYSERTVRDHIKVMEEARMVHAQPRPKWSGGREFDQLTITWAEFHVEDEAEPAGASVSGGVVTDAEPAAPSTEPAAPSTEPAAPADSFLSKNVRSSNGAAAPSGQDQARDRAKPSVPITSSAKDDSLDGYDGPVWDGNLDRLIIPARFSCRPQTYHVSADGSVARHPGGPGPGEIRAELNFYEIKQDRLARFGHDRPLAEKEVA